MNTSPEAAALAVLSEAYRLAPHPTFIIDTHGTVAAANRAALRLWPEVECTDLADSLDTDPEALGEMIDRATGSTVPVLARLDMTQATLSVRLWRLAPLPGLPGPLLVIQGDRSQELAGRFLRAEQLASDAQKRLRKTIDAHERLAEMARMLKERADSDPLTGTLNARAFAAAVGKRLSEAPGALVYLDLNRFKPVNDRFGHAAGDAVLKAIAERLSGCLRGRDLVARIGGDEFAVWVDGACPDDWSGLHTRIAHAVSRPVAWRGNGPGAAVELVVTAAIGTAFAPAEGRAYAALLALADSRMYAGKPAGSFARGIAG
ncbi:diguanylate cyclase [Rhodobacterales bacterium HKCCE2091]|nr:diguanylate cyclase [Rhodobacterales bacterium HKCCE2091]